jgi:hypothetical protein
MNNKQIAQEIRRKFQDDECRLIDGNRLEFNIDGLTLRCRNWVDDVNKMADKYHKGLPINLLYRAPGPRSTARVCSVMTFLSFWDDGEIENAKCYLDQFPQDKWPNKVNDILRGA